MKRVLTRALLAPVTLGMGFGHQRPKRAARITWRGFPVKAVLFARCAFEFQRIFRRSASVGVHGGVLMLGFDVGIADADGIEFVPSDVPVDDLLLARIGVKNPL